MLRKGIESRYTDFRLYVATNTVRRSRLTIEARYSIPDEISLAI